MEHIAYSLPKYNAFILIMLQIRIQRFIIAVTYEKYFEEIDWFSDQLRDDCILR